jgi:hypothetical protein
MSVALPKYRETRRLKSPCGSNAGFLCDNGWHYLVPAVVRFAFFLGTALLFLCTGAAGICPCRALSPHLHGMRFCTRCGIVTLGECPKKEHSFTYSLHHIGAFWLISSKYWDFSSIWSCIGPGLCPDFYNARVRAWAERQSRAWPIRLYVSFIPRFQTYIPFLSPAP